MFKFDFVLSIDTHIMKLIHVCRVEIEVVSMSLYENKFIFCGMANGHIESLIDNGGEVFELECFSGTAVSIADAIQSTITIYGDRTA